ncbi:uncharacterized protein EI97DRAFT_43856 [Westerdykella ornata]|uniref:Uncharacterized protein n=1 Tax=Westerdykella ornata TaxID=318751 RepID=A0A6A6JNP6_WESOR|nr:uncharacterized protein EI97DRAFT_43856 [Westerdykella ornata]KAF2276549.1 hypothetical protein EI97DRAFT_43856 [Westerdykella ornata]
MGGQAFAKAGPDGSALNVPRMPTSTYQALSSEIQRKLQTMFRNVALPREAPGKADHGDIDVLVEGAMTQWNPDTLKELLGAEYFYDNGGTKSYAVPYADSPDEYFQVDVEICPGEGTPDSTDLFKWTLFLKSDSDLLQIIGICHRSLGIKCNDRGLHLRVPEIESYNKKKSLLFLTRDPDEAMKFYGLDTAKYWEGFRDEEELFEWVANGRFFHPSIFDTRQEKANDRARQRKRPMYSRFVENFMPRRIEAGSENEPWTPEQVRKEALDTFGKHREYEEMLAEHRTRERDIAIWERVKEALPVQGKQLTTALRSLRRWVDFKDGHPFITSEAMITEQPLWGAAVVDEELVLSWVRENWEQVKKLERARVVSLEQGCLRYGKTIEYTAMYRVE